MNSVSYKNILLLMLLLLCKGSYSQSPAFYHLSIDNGLYDNHVRSLALSKQGLLWIGSEEGLNLYDGHSFSSYTKDKYPGLPSNYITHLFCDSRNRLWIGTADGAALMNNKQQVSRIVLQDTIKKFSARAFVEIEDDHIVLISSLGHFLYVEAKKKWEKINNIPVVISNENISALQFYNGSQVLFATPGAVTLFDYATGKIVNRFPADDVKGICKLKGQAFALLHSSGEVQEINAQNGSINRRYQLNKTDPVDIEQAANGDLVIALGLNGLAIIDTTGHMAYFVHNPIIPTSLVSNSAYRVVTGSNGEVVIGTSTSGVSIYNTKLSQAGFTAFFRDATGNYYDNYTGQLVQNGSYCWIGAYDRLIKWNRKNNTSTFYYYTSQNATQKKLLSISALCMDRSGIVWVGTEGGGIAWFSETTGKFTEIKLDTTLSPVFKSRNMLDMLQDENGLIWVGTGRGIFTINPVAKTAGVAMHAALQKELSGKIVHDIFIDAKKRIWFATIGNGIYCFEKNGHQVFHYTTKDGLASDICYMLAQDKKGRFFASTSKGFSVIGETGILRTLTKENGLGYERCESVLIDNDDIVWFSNRKRLVRYDADHNSMQFFDEKAGLLNNGFRVGSCLKTSTGELLWGGYRGVSYFDPRQLKNATLPLKTAVYCLSLQDSVMDLSAQNSFKTLYANNRVSFGFAGMHLGIPGKTFYQYRLKGFDKDWQKGEDISQARYSALPPGTYSFELKASMDGIKWVEAPQKISVTVIPPLWMRRWFIALVVTLLAGLAAWFIRNRNKKIKKHRDDLETEKAINHFANSLHGQQTVENILWDVARNCIGRLQFEDCVIYLLDETNNVLIQKAAYGPKSPKNFQITQPLEIPVGKGITGNVALTGTGEIVGDTSKDHRYIMDDIQRLSEIAVPITWGDKVIGVIDCEHHKKNYFTQKHLSILNTIASLCANKIVSARAEEAKQKAQLVLTDTQQKMAEVEMQALRAQMNPHFIFNCLNSINRYIVKSDQATASLYLTRFAKLIRLILDNSASKNITLSNELEALKLYITMEALRFDKKFTYSIAVDKNISTDSIALPPLIIQPYVENAIWHGLLHKNGGGQLTISIKLLEESMLECTIEDNGVGRGKAAELKSKSATSRKSLGMQLTENRLALLNRHAELNASISIIDLYDTEGQAAGTRVVLLIPV